jgi:hypothetical protein
MKAACRISAGARTMGSQQCVVLRITPPAKGFRPVEPQGDAAMSDSNVRQKTTTTSFRMTQTERAAVVMAADAAGMGPSTFARVSVLRAAGREAPIRKRRDAIATVIAPVLGELGRVGNNLNQLTRHAHVGGRVDSRSLNQLRDETERLTLAVLAFREVSPT